MHSKAVRFQMGSLSISSRIYRLIMAPHRSLYTNAKLKFITTMGRCLNARHCSMYPVSARKTLTTVQPKFQQRLITARATLAKQRWSSVQEFCVGLVAPSVHELASSDAKLWLGVAGTMVNSAGAENFPFLTARNVLCSAKPSGGRAYAALPDL